MLPCYLHAQQASDNIVLCSKAPLLFPEVQKLDITVALLLDPQLDLRVAPLALALRHNLQTPSQRHTTIEVAETFSELLGSLTQNRLTFILVLPYCSQYT